MLLAICIIAAIVLGLLSLHLGAKHYSSKTLMSKLFCIISELREMVDDDAVTKKEIVAMLTRHDNDISVLRYRLGIRAGPIKFFSSRLRGQAEQNE